MSPNSPGAFMLSATLHGAAVIIALLFGYVSRSDKPPEKILELVAGEGDNFMATEAPALGSSDGLKSNVPKVAAPKPTPPEPVRQEAPPTPPTPTPPVPAPAAPPEKPVPDFAKQVRRNIIVGESKAKQQIKKEQAAEKKRAEEDAKKISKEEYDRTHNPKNNPPPKVASNKSPKVDAEGIAGEGKLRPLGLQSGQRVKQIENDALDVHGGATALG